MEKTDILTDRQKFILTLVIHEYTRTASPVGSKNLVKNYHLDLSPATVRSELAVLVDLGYLDNSYGRVPTRKGYRYFVQRLLKESELPDATRRMISHQFYQTRKDVEEWMRLAASTLAIQSRAASVVTAPQPENSRLKHLELISTRGRQVLLVLVTMGGEFHQHLLVLDEPLPQESLSGTADRLTHLFYNKGFEEIRTLETTLQGFEHEITGWILEDMEQSSLLVSTDVYLDGMTNVLAEPEFSGSAEGRQTLRLLEERSLMHDLLARTAGNTDVGGMQVLIGGEGNWEELNQCSMVLARYGIPGLSTGLLGVLGPMRMPYGRAISTVRYVSSLLSEMLSESLVD